jgi:D-cysteine desulfhydrase family pyridoxal phosphate-dependent enzyme
VSSIVPRIQLAQLPTPLHRLDRVSGDLGADIYIKRDDLTGLALGGNKARKLEYLLADALAQGAEVVVTCGGIHSNFIRQLGAACAQLGLQSAAAVMELPFETSPVSGLRLRRDRGNPMLSELFGVDLRIYQDGEWEELYGLADQLAVEYEELGKKVYRIPVGGSSPLGAYAFYRAAEEVREERFDWIVFASSSGSTQTGLAYAFQGTSTHVLGIASDPEPEIAQDFAELGYGLANLIGETRLLQPKQFNIDFDFVGEGYGVSSPEGDEAIKYLAATEGILVDPIYTGKAFAGLLKLVPSRILCGRILFWHTGGIPSLFAR